MIGKIRKKENQTGLMEAEQRKEEWKTGSINGSVSAALMIPVIFFFTVLFLLFMGGLITLQSGRMGKEVEPMEIQRETNPLAEVAYKKDHEVEMDHSNQVRENTQDWINRIFGNAGPVSVIGKITIAGLSEQAKTELNFIESDFMKDLGSFFNKQGIITSLVYFEERTICSADNAQSYVASMSGISDKNLQVIFYPEIPGGYIFLLTEKQKLVVKNNDMPVSEQRSLDQSTLQHTQSAPQILQNQESQSQENQFKEKQSDEKIYDASALSIYAVSDELLNYIGNQYLLQYALYDHIYQCGYYNVKSATVVNYSINGDERSATILFVLDNGKSVSAVYSLSDGSYQFS